MHPQQLLGNRYRLVEELGSGGMGVVWRAHDRVLNRFVAVKVLAGALAADPIFRRRIRAEAQAAARLWHPNITDVYDYGESPGLDGEPVPYVVMELLPGPTLAQRLESGPLAPDVALRICSEVASAIAAAHEQQLVHRDIKPSNVVLTPSGTKVVDFGIAAVAGQDTDAAYPVMGTPAYLAPERLAGGQVLPASDVYALGLLIHRTLTNHLPWASETTTKMLRARVYLEPRPLPPMAQVPLEVNEICLQCLAKDPHERPTASVVAAVLAKAVGTVAALPQPAPLDRPTVSPAAETAPAAALRLAAKAWHGRRRLATAGMVLVVAAILGMGWMLAIPGPADSAGFGTARTPDSAGSIAQGAPARPFSPLPAPSGSTQVRPSPTSSASQFSPASSASQSSSASPASQSSSASPVSSPLGVPIAARGGVVWARCDDNRTARILEVDPAAGYTLKDLYTGPAAEVRAVFESAADTSEVKIRCAAGQLVPRVRESPE